MTGIDYVHGYSDREGQRLQDQSNALAELLHHDTLYPPGAEVLEVGCGIGAQTVHLALGSPEARITSVDISPQSVERARERLARIGGANVRFQVADLFALPFAEGSFDHVFVCFVLEHLADPVAALAALRRVLRPGGTITVIEGDHGSTYFHPDSAAAHRAIQALVAAQDRAGGNALIGRQLYPLLVRAGFADPRVSPRMVYVDGSRPGLIQGFTRDTFTAMVEGVRERALELGLVDAPTFDQGVADLYRTAAADGVFCYTFFKAVASR